MVKLRKNSEIQAKFSFDFWAPLDKSGQPGKNGQNEASNDPIQALKRRARSKWYTSKIVGRLLYVDSPLHDYYQRAYYCCNTLVQEGKKITGKYCDTRICHICNRIRTAKMISGYVRQLLTLENLEMTTLTLPNCAKNELRPTIEKMIREWVKIMDVFGKKKIAVNGLRKIEVTHNINRDDYHPHFHLLNDGGHGDKLVNEWLKRFPNAVISAQDVRPADKGSLAEIFKYATKIVTHKKGTLQINIPAIDVIMNALYKKRCFQPFGKIKKVTEEVEALEAMELPDGSESSEILFWLWNECDWILSGSKMNTLTGYVPPEVDFEFYEC